MRVQGCGVHGEAVKPSEYLSLSERLDRIEDMVKALVEFNGAITEQETSRALEKVRKLSEAKHASASGKPRV